MKNILIKVIAILIIVIIFVIPIIGTIITPVHKTELTTITEITTIEENTTIDCEENKNINNFAAKLTRIQLFYDKELIVSTEESTTVTINKEVTETTKRNNIEKQTTIIDEITIHQETTTMEELEITTSSNTNNYNKNKYESAVTIWNYLKSLGYNDYICAGIMGNIMSECGGHTLNIEWWMNDNGYYGICQWYKPYYPEVFGTDLQTQLNFLAQTIRKEFNTFGYKYYSGFNYEKFLQLTSIDEAARAFAACYERCATWTYSSRVSNGHKAYQYFVG